MLSRVANSIYWMSRYIERAENVARFIDVNVTLTLDLGESIPEQWLPLVAITGDQAPFLERYGQATRQNVERFLMFDMQNPNSIAACLRQARENARSIRESIPPELWEELNKFYHIVRGTDPDSLAEEPGPMLELVKTSSQLLIGIIDGCMSRGEAWHFARMGRLLERADKTSRILDVKYFLLLPSVQDVGTPLDIIEWSALLKSASALQMYHRSRGRISPAQVVDFLILERDFPRSIRFCLERAEKSLKAITGNQNGSTTPAEVELNNLCSQFDFTYVDDIIEEGLHEFLDRFQSRLNRVDDAIFGTFFALQPFAGTAQTAGGQQA